MHWGWLLQSMTPRHSNVLLIALLCDTQTWCQNPSRYSQEPNSVLHHGSVPQHLFSSGVLLPSSPILCASIPESTNPHHSGSLSRNWLRETLIWAATMQKPLKGHPWLTAGFNAGVRWRRLSPVPTGIFHVRPVRSKVLQVGISTNHSKFPADKSIYTYIREYGGWPSNSFLQSLFLWHAQNCSRVSALFLMHTHVHDRLPV